METVHLRAMQTIPAPVADALLARGCCSVNDVLARPGDVQDVLRQLQDAESERKAEAIIAGCRREIESIWTSSDSALDLLHRAQVQAPLTLPCQALSALLGNAVRPGSGRILEICGLPGCGKTQLCLQICASAQARGVPGEGYAEAVYVDAEGSFMARRYAQVCRAALQAQRHRRPQNPGQSDAAELEMVLRGMYVCRTYDAAELYATVKQLGHFLQTHRRVRAFVIDSLAFCFRHEFSDNVPQRARILNDIAGMLRRYSSELGIVVVVTNHMTTKFDRSSNDNGWLSPALGETWAHQPGTQVRLERCQGPVGAPALAQSRVLVQAGAPRAAVAALASGEGQRLATGTASVAAARLPVSLSHGHGPLGMATLTKSMEQAVGRSCYFRITEDGICDVEGADALVAQLGA